MGSVEVTRENLISTIEFYHPSHNSLPSLLLDKLTTAITEEGRYDQTTIIVLRSAGDRTFCAGASFDELSSISNKSEGKIFFSGFANVINAIRSCGKLVIGRVQGKAVGGGVGLAAAVDYCMATKYASIKLSELAVGIGPFVVGPAVERKVGLSAMSQMAINANEWQTATWAKDKGLFTEVFESTDQLDAYIKEFALKLSIMNPDAMHNLKRIFWSGTDNWDQLLTDRAEISGRLVLTKPARQAIYKFLKPSNA